MCRALILAILLAGLMQTAAAEPASFEWTKEKFDLSLGGSYSFGRDDTLPQIVNLSDPTIDNNFFGVRDNSAIARYNQISFYFGFTYFFPRI